MELSPWEKYQKVKNDNLKLFAANGAYACGVAAIAAYAAYDCIDEAVQQYNAGVHFEKLRDAHLGTEVASEADKIAQRKYALCRESVCAGAISGLCLALMGYRLLYLVKKFRTFRTDMEKSKTGAALATLLDAKKLGK